MVIVDILPRSSFGLEIFPKYIQGMKNLHLCSPKSFREAEAFMKDVEPNAEICETLLSNLKPSKTNLGTFQFTSNLETFSNSISLLSKFPSLPPSMLPVGGEFPVTLVLGKQSVFLPREPAIGGLKGELNLFERSFFPGRVRTIWIDGAGHMPHIEKPEAFFKEVSNSIDT